MTRYENGFLTKCAEYGVPGHVAKGMLMQKTGGSLASLKGWLRMAGSDGSRFEKALGHAARSAKYGRPGAAGMVTSRDAARYSLLKAISDRNDASYVLSAVDKAVGSAEAANRKIKNFVDIPLTESELGRKVMSALKERASALHSSGAVEHGRLLGSAADFLRY